MSSSTSGRTATWPRVPWRSWTRVLPSVDLPRVKSASFHSPSTGKPTTIASLARLKLHALKLYYGASSKSKPARFQKYSELCVVLLKIISAGGSWRQEMVLHSHDQWWSTRARCGGLGRVPRHVWDVSDSDWSQLWSDLCPTVHVAGGHVWHVHHLGVGWGAGGTALVFYQGEIN